MYIDLTVGTFEIFGFQTENLKNKRSRYINIYVFSHMYTGRSLFKFMYYAKSYKKFFLSLFWLILHNNDEE